MAERSALSCFPYVISERDISVQLDRPIPPIRVFTLEALGIDRAKFLQDMRIAFSGLHLDPFDGKRSKVAFLKSKFPEQTDRLEAFQADYYRDRADLNKLFDLIGRLSDGERNEFDRIGMTGRRKRSIAKFLLANDGVGTP